MKGFILLLVVSFVVFAFVSVGVAQTVGGGDILYKVKHIGDVKFSHDSHVTDRGFKCEDCHPAIFPLPKVKGKRRTMAEMRAKSACGVCHNGKSAFDVGANCYICHKK